MKDPDDLSYLPKELAEDLAAYVGTPRTLDRLEQGEINFGREVFSTEKDNKPATCICGHIKSKHQHPRDDFSSEITMLNCRVEECECEDFFEKRTQVFDESK